MATGVCSSSSNNNKNNVARAIGVGFCCCGGIFLGEGLANHKICSAFEQRQTTHTHKQTYSMSRTQCGCPLHVCMVRSVEVFRLRLRAAKCLLNRFNLFVKLPLNLYSCLADMKEAFVVRPLSPTPLLKPPFLCYGVWQSVETTTATETEACPMCSQTYLG